MSARAAALLRSAGLLAAVLAIVAGFIGMHVLAGTHAAHVAATVPAGHADHPAGHHLGAVGVVGAASDTCCGDCSAPASTGADCVPSPKHADWEATPPGTVATAVDHHAVLPRLLARSYPHSPRSPSPGELSISQT
jgi:hypothetical protein